MQSKHKKLYLVKREVRADSIDEAIKNEQKGDIYCIELAEEKFQPEEKSKGMGFKSNECSRTI